MLRQRLCFDVEINEISTNREMYLSMWYQFSREDQKHHFSVKTVTCIIQDAFIVFLRRNRLDSMNHIHILENQHNLQCNAFITSRGKTERRGKKRWNGKNGRKVHYMEQVGRNVTFHCSKSSFSVAELSLRS